MFMAVNVVMVISLVDLDFVVHDYFITILDETDYAAEVVPVRVSPDLNNKY